MSASTCFFFRISLVVSHNRQGMIKCEELALSVYVLYCSMSANAVLRPFKHSYVSLRPPPELKMHFKIDKDLGRGLHVCGKWHILLPCL